MKTRLTIGSAVIALIACAVNGTASSILTNGSFEEYGGRGFNSNLGAGLPGWTIGVPGTFDTGGIDIVFSTGTGPTYWQAADGNVSLSLNYFTPAIISQTVATIPGTTYRLSFFMGAEIYGGSASRTMAAIWNGTVIGTPSVQYTGQGPTNMGWVKFSYDVVGTGNDILAFQSKTTGPYGPTLDAVSLAPVECIPNAATATAAVLNGLVVAINITGNGCGYTNAPLVELRGGGGSGAKATATINNGFVTGITVTSAEIGYTNAPKVLIASPPFVPWLSIAVGTVKVTQHVVLGRNYVFESSSDNQKWVQIGIPFTAQDEVITQEFDVDVTGRYFHIREVP